MQCQTLPRPRCPVLTRPAAQRRRCVRQQAVPQPVSSEAALKGSIADSPEFKALEEHVNFINQVHLKDLLDDDIRTEMLTKEHDGVYVDFSRQRVTQGTLDKLIALAKASGLAEKIEAMESGQKINITQTRAALHHAQRARRDQAIVVGAENVVPSIWEQLDIIKDFSEKLRDGTLRGYTGVRIRNVVSIGIGGNYNGPMFVHTALKYDSTAIKASDGRKLRFLANVDPVDVARALAGLNQEETMVIVISKSFTTTETMLNARTVRTWLTAELGEEALADHLAAVTSAPRLATQFGVPAEHIFPFSEWVTGRYSATSPVGVLPLAVQYGFNQVEMLLLGANHMDTHFRAAPFSQNIPVLMGLLSVWNSTFLGYPGRALLPYCQALSKLPAHVQQVSMESNGKGVDIIGKRLPHDAGEIDFGEPGTNGQHSFYQLIHQGRVVPCDFIGTVRSQRSVYLKGELVSNHDELMCNFFAQADALAYGKDEATLREEGVADELIPHRTFSGNRPSLSIMMPKLSAYEIGQLLSMYENRTIVQGFVWGLNSFDQWGEQMAKEPVSRVRKSMHAARTKGSDFTGYNPSTTRMMNWYLSGKKESSYPVPRDCFPSDILTGSHICETGEDEEGGCISFVSQDEGDM